MAGNGPKLLVEEISYIDNASEVLESLFGDRMPFLLESAMLMERYGRYSILGSDPVMVARSKNGVTEVFDSGSRKAFINDPLKVIDEQIRSFGHVVNEEYSWLPFTGGAVGYFGYDLNRQIERMPDIAEDDLGIPDLYLGFYTEAVIIDHKDRRTFAIAYTKNASKRGLKEAKARLDRLIVKASTCSACDKAASALRTSYKGENGSVAANLTSNFTRKDYNEMISKAKHYISEGDIFQVNLAQRFAIDLKVDHYALYKYLREKNPAPFAAFLDYGDFSILSSSPERFMLVDDRYVETRPIKGTRPRYKDREKDEVAIKDLKASEKDSAEHVMIVDVKRNDLGRVCEFGSVKVPDLMVVESYEAVHHLVSTVTGELRSGVGAMDLIKASFPGGSITGAPKIRAMEIIEELEPHRRNIYCGSIGYISTNGKMDTNIVIRTITAIGNKAYLQVGGGIVADSDPDAEYQETLDKARALFDALDLRRTALLESIY